MSALAEYFLHVELLVTEDNSAKFESLVHDFVRQGSFKRFTPTADLRLALGLRTAKPFVYTSNPGSGMGKDQFVDSDPLRGQSVVKYVNLWQVQSLEGLDLAPIMTASADDSLYIAIDSRVASETQEFVVRMRWPLDPPGTHILGSNGFLRVTRHFYTSKDLAFYAYNIPVVRRLQERTGIQNVGYFQSTTGTLETISEFWQVPPDATSVSAATLDYSAKYAGASKEQLDLVAQLQRLRQDERHELYRSYL